MKALIIEDDSGVCAAVRAVITAYEITAAETMDVAISTLQNDTFDIVFLDLALPDSTVEKTLQLIPLLRRLAGNAGIILMTGFHAEIGNAVKAVDAMLLKPFASRHIREAVDAAERSRVRTKCATGDTVNACRAMLAFS